MGEPAESTGTEPPPEQVPLLLPNQSPELESQSEQHRLEGRENDGDGENCELDRELRSLGTLLGFLGFHQYSLPTFVFSWFVFLLIGVALPVTVLELIGCEITEKHHCETLEMYIVASQACLAAMSLLCISHNLRKRGMKKFLFVDREKGLISRLSCMYVEQIRGSLKLLQLWSLPCIIMKVALEIIRALYATQGPWWLYMAVPFSLSLSWTYLSVVTLSASIMFHLVCNLQVIHFDEYLKLVWEGSDVSKLIHEHINLRYHLSKISHRFRIFLVMQSLFVTASQILTLFQTTGFEGVNKYISSGDFAVSSIVQVAGIIISLHAATRISHKAQTTASSASVWHAMVTGYPANASQTRLSSSNRSLEGDITNSLMRASYSESDLESMDGAVIPTNIQLASCMTSYQRRQAYVTYMQMNPGGITIYGWMVDRVFLNTIFCVELTLLTFVLGKTLVLET